MAKLSTPPYNAPLNDPVTGSVLRDWILWFTQIFNMFQNKGWTPTFSGLTVVGTYTVKAQYVITGNMLFWDVIVTPNSGSTVAYPPGSAITNVPLPANTPGGVLTANGFQQVLDLTNGADLGRGLVAAGQTYAYMPTAGIAATGHAISINGQVRII